MVGIVRAQAAHVVWFGSVQPVVFGIFFFVYQRPAPNGPARDVASLLAATVAVAAAGTLRFGIAPSGLVEAEDASAGALAAGVGWWARDTFHAGFRGNQRRSDLVKFFTRYGILPCLRTT